LSTATALDDELNCSIKLLEHFTAWLLAVLHQNDLPIIHDENTWCLVNPDPSNDFNGGNGY
jgi:hypothetical protein